jgi:hypothetical protein
MRITVTGAILILAGIVIVLLLLDSLPNGGNSKSTTLLSTVGN